MVGGGSGVTGAAQRRDRAERRPGDPDRDAQRGLANAPNAVRQRAARGDRPAPPPLTGPLSAEAPQLALVVERHPLVPA